VISRYPFRNITDVGIGSPNRGLTMGLIDVPGTNGLGVFGAHFAAGGTSADAVQRQTHAENTRDRIREWRIRNRRAAYVLGGDLNENEDPDLSSTFPIGGTLPDGRTYAPISTVQSARLRDTVPVDALGGKRTYQVSSRNSDLRRRLDYIMVSPTELGRDRINVLEATIFNTRRFASWADCLQASRSPTARTPPITLRCLCAFGLTGGVPTATAAGATGFPNRVRCSRCWFSRVGVLP
jgi:endonuclease/exonuclease/phosphatase family metal-dependent hydrolase